MIQISEKYDKQAMVNVFENIESYFDQPEKILKNDATSTVIKVLIENKAYVIKRANTKNTLHIFRRALQKSRAAKNWDNALRLEKAQIPAVQGVAMMEERWGPFKGRSYFVCPYIEGIDALHFFALGAKPQSNWPEVAKNIVAMMSALARHHLSHRDLNLSNILLVGNIPHLLDLDAMSHYKTAWFAKRAANRERRRFMKNWQLVPDVDHSVAALFEKYIG